jgi:sortase A
MNKRAIATMVIGAVMILGALSLVIYNAREEERASSSVEDLLPKIEQLISDNSVSQTASANTSKTMATVTIDGNEYIGVLKIPAIGIELPVISSWSYPLLKLSPCRYSGSVIETPLVIAGHNYTRHFGKLVNLVPGDTLYFTDVNGIVYEYTVSDITSLQKTQISEMESSEWDLTLFTCDYRGRLRIAVRCDMTAGPMY